MNYMLHGDKVGPGIDPLLYCAKCETTHSVALPSCDGLRGGWPPKVLTPEDEKRQARENFLHMRCFEKPTDPAKPALARQEGGGHYKDMAIQPFTYIHANGLPFAEGCVVKYVSRWRAKGGVEDLKKARHFLDLLIEAEGKPSGERLGE